MTQNSKSREFFIQGLTLDGQTFRPSDWAERLCGVLACFGPSRGPQAYLQYSPYCQPIMVGKLKCVVVDERLREIEPMAFSFVMNFAHDNRLQISEACLVPEPPKVARTKPSDQS